MPVTPTLPPVVSPALAEALALHRQGHLEAAEARYARILIKQPGNVVARFHQGLARLQRGDFEGGIGAFRQVLKWAPDHAEAHFNLGHAYLQRGRAEEAHKCFQRVVELAPSVAQGHFFLGLSLFILKRFGESVPAFEQAIALDPNLAEAHHNIGSALNESGRQQNAIAHFEQALALRPSFAEARNGLGIALLALRSYDEAVEQFQQAIALRPDFAEPHQGLGTALIKLNRYAEAAEQFQQALGRNPNNVKAICGLGAALLETGDIEMAHACWERAIEFDPEWSESYLGLGRELKMKGEDSRALACFEKAIQLDGANHGAHAELGSSLFFWDRYEDGMTHLQQAIDLSPDEPLWQASLLYQLHFYPGFPAMEQAIRHRAFGERFEAKLKPTWTPHANVPDIGRPLRVGFVSGDFRQHSVGHFMAGLLPSLKATGLELVAYANQTKHDAMTDRMKAQFSAWRECETLSDGKLAEQIRADAIDVLVDLSGHTSGNRLLVFARKPAPVQVTYLGYPDTTGLSAIDYILGDPRMFPVGEEALYVEKPWRLPDTSLCFMPPDLPVEVDPLPATQNGYVTFGCMNNRGKVNDAVIETWARILSAVPGSRMLLQNKPYGDTGVADYVRSRFAARGIAGDRLGMIGSLPWREHLEMYNRVDIALDPFPYNGTTTSVEGLWMGVPVLALKGDRLVSHMGESILHAVKMPEWIAADKTDYVAEAVAFAGDLPALAEIRAGLRPRLLASPICDAPRFARNMEAAFRGMWQKWCEKQQSFLGGNGGPSA